MELKPDYKQTEVGNIPNDWEVVNLSSLTKGLQNGVFFQPSRKGLGVKLINVGNLYTHIPIDFENLELFDATYDEITRFKVDSGDLFFTRSSVVPSGIAHCNIYLSPNQEAVVFDSHVIRCRPDQNKINPEYLFRFCVSATARNYLVSHSKTGTMTTIDQGVLSRCPVILPPTLAEQEAIAETLSDADALIEALEGLIAKKRQVKQGAMQELLTGKRRLSGFEKIWETKRLDDIFDITAGGDFDRTRSSDTQDERFPYPIYSNALLDRGIYGFSSYNDHQSGSITVTARGTIGVTNYRDHDFTAIGRVLVLKPLQPLDGRFISEYLNSQVEFVVESTGVPQLTAPQISKYEILFPEFPEQSAIAEILSDMDAEIAALETKLSKARAVKQGMMSVLLTGKIRLV
jgi:type I restriction enzyme S subunit